MEQEHIKAVALSPGMSVGNLVVPTMHSPTQDTLSERTIADPETEYLRFEKEAESVILDLEEAVQILNRDLFFEEAEIIQTHIHMLNDSEFRKQIHERIMRDNLAVEVAMDQVLRQMVTLFENSGDIVFAERVADLKDVMGRLRRKLLNENEEVLSLALNGVRDPVVVLKELFPSIMIELRQMNVQAIIVENGTSISHSAILAKSFGIPVLKVQNVKALVQKNRMKVLVDAHGGELIINPDRKNLQRINNTKRTAPQTHTEYVPVSVWLNVIDPQQLNDKILGWVKGIGLFRTEFLFMEKDDNFPTEEEQYIQYRALFKKCPAFPITVRTLDIGGDKTLPYFSFGPQENPHLGFRAHRVFRFHPEIFLNQVRALLRAGIYSERLRILYPMIESVDELLFMKELLHDAIASLKKEESDFKQDFEQGVLIEVPSAAWNFKDILKYVDFASIGSNDLFQYFFAVDRNNANVTHSYQPENPASLKLIKSLVEIAKESGKPLSICGEIANDQFFLPILIGLGINHISIDSHVVQEVREYLSGIDLLSCKEMAKKCINAETSAEVLKIVASFGSNKTYFTGYVGKQIAGHVDPVCQMVVHEDEKSLSFISNGKKYYFCSANCRDMFLKQNT